MRDQIGLVAGTGDRNLSLPKHTHQVRNVNGAPGSRELSDNRFHGRMFRIEICSRHCD
jgi:hypothetical protein